MADNPRDLRYSKEHEWVKLLTDGTALVGITLFAQEELGDIVFISLPAVGSSVSQFAKMGEIESVKAVSDLFSPISGEVVEVNEEAVDSPEVVNQDPYGKAWLVKLRATDSREVDSLLTAEQYEAFLAAEAKAKEEKS